MLIGLGSLACFADTWNNPYPAHYQNKNIYHSSFTKSPKTLDPARSYSSDEWMFIAQIYEPPLQYHYLKRPYELIPLTTEAVPKPIYYNQAGKKLPNNAPKKDIAYSVYRIQIKPNIYYQPHPAFSKKNGQYLYHRLSPEALNKIQDLNDFKQQATRELTAEDYVLQIKRLADPKNHSPIYSVLAAHIIGFKAYHLKLLTLRKSHAFLDLRRYPLSGVRVVNKYTYEIKIKGKYPQFIYWLAMPFFAPMPWEAEYFYAQPGLINKNITLGTTPIGTGAYYLKENNPNLHMILQKNPNFHGETYPHEGAAGDVEKGYLVDAGKPLPMIDTVVFTLEKEDIPRWNKFLQGYYDRSAISNDSFEQAIKVTKAGKPLLTKEMEKRNIRLQTSIGASISYMGFNMLDDVVGGKSRRAKLLRQAISIAVDYDEYINLFLNGRGIVANGPIPPGIEGYVQGQQGINPNVYFWENGQAIRHPIEKARKLLAEAGYKNGIDPKTGKPLVLNYDVISSAGPDDKARLTWMRKQFDKLGIVLHIRATHYNRFQDKIRTGNAQIFSWGWHADYPDPENFLFLLFGDNGKVKRGGENASNYHNPAYDKLFIQMRDMPSGPKRQAVIASMLKLLQDDAPWVFAFHPKNFVLAHAWSRESKPNSVANNTLKYARIDINKRRESRTLWNQPITWPLVLFLLMLLLILLPAVIRFWQHEYRVKRHD